MTDLEVPGELGGGMLFADGRRDWRCTCCGRRLSDDVAGEAFEHRCPGLAAQCGHFEAEPTTLGTGEHR